MALEIPTWLNEAFVEKVLRKSKGDNSLQVINIFSKPATNKGDNYTSDMIRVNVEFSLNHNDRKITKEKSIIVKIAPTTEGPRKDLVVLSGLFDTEISMMADTLDRMNTLLGFKERLSGKCLYVQKDNPPLLVMEDLAPLGFRMADRLSGLDLDHSILAIRGLARFHATSVAVYEEDPKLKQMYSKGIFNSQHPPDMGNFFIFSCKALADEIVNWPELKKYSEKIIKLTDRIYQVGIEACKPDENEFNVINHGDFWVNNMMFKYNDDGKPTDHIFVDFQLSFYGSPALDLLHFLNTSRPSTDVIENKKNVLLNEYLDILSTTMKQLNCKTQPPTMEELNAALKRKAVYGMVISFSMLPFVLCKENEVKGFDEFLIKENDTSKNTCVKNEIFQQMIKKKIPIYDKWGLLDL